MNGEQAISAEHNGKMPKPLRVILSIIDGSFLTRDRMVRNIPYFLFLFALSVLYIANSHYADKVVIRINSMEKELKELRSDFITTRSDLMYASKQSAVAKAVAAEGIRESVAPPKKIVINPEQKIH